MRNQNNPIRLISKLRTEPYLHRSTTPICSFSSSRYMSGLRRFVIAALLTVGVHTLSFSQQQSGLQGEVEVGSFLSSESATLFWLRTNQYGIVPLQSTAHLMQAAIWKPYRAPDSTHTQKVDWGFKLNPAITYDQTDKQKIILPEAYIKVRFNAIEFYAGRWRGVTGLGDTALSSGFYAVSGNALPIPNYKSERSATRPSISRTISWPSTRHFRTAGLRCPLSRAFASIKSTFIYVSENQGPG